MPVRSSPLDGPKFTIGPQQYWDEWPRSSASVLLQEIRPGLLGRAAAREIESPRR